MFLTQGKALRPSIVLMVGEACRAERNTSGDDDKLLHDQQRTIAMISEMV